MHAHCPNCQSSFEVSSERLPAPKFNTVYNAFGWKFECGHCDTQWWVCLNEMEPARATPPRRERPTNNHLADLVHPATQRTMAQRPSNYTQTRTNNNAHSHTQARQNSHHGAPYGSYEPPYEAPAPRPVQSRIEPLRLQDNDSPIVKKRRRPLRWIGYTLLLCIGVLAFEYHYPRVIRQTFKKINFQSALNYLRITPASVSQQPLAAAPTAAPTQAPAPIATTLAVPAQNTAQTPAEAPSQAPAEVSVPTALAPTAATPPTPASTPTPPSAPTQAAAPGVVPLPA